MLKGELSILLYVRMFMYIVTVAFWYALYLFDRDFFD